MTEPTTPARLRLIAYPFELVKGDVVPEQMTYKGGQVRSTETTDPEQVVITYRNGSTETIPRGFIIDVDRVTDLIAGYEPDDDES